MDLVTLRTALLITLSILLLIVLYQRFRRRVLARDLPVPRHAELVRLEVAYHPVRLLVVVELPEAQSIQVSLADERHEPLHHWPEERKDPGSHALELILPALPEGVYHFTLATATQRTVRRFRLQP